ncbi:MAG: xylulokinase [Thermoproteus sp.]
MMVGGVDLGTTNIKLIIIDITNNRIINLYKVKTPIVYNNEFIDVERIFSQFMELVHTVTRKFDIKAIGFSTMAPVFIPVRVDGGAYGGLMYNSNVGAEYLSEFDVNKILDITLNPPNVQMVLQKILWLKRNKIDIYNNTYKFLDLNGYLFMKLTGKYKQDNHIALEWGLLDHRSRDWSSELIEVLGRDVRDKLPELVDPLYVEGGYVIGTVDVVASAYGLDMTPRRAMASYGTTFCGGVISENPRPDPSKYIDLYLGQGYLVNGCTSMYGSIIDWFKESISDAFSLEHVDARPTREIVLPYLKGERAPVFDPHASGVFFGISDDTKLADIWKALVHSLAYMATHVLESLITNEDEIVSYGGLAREPILSIVAALLRRRIVVVDVEAAALGAARIAAESIGKDIDIQQFLSIQKYVDPDDVLMDLHINNYKKYKRLYILLKDLFRE